MHIVPWVAGDPTAVRAHYELTLAVERADDPAGLPMTERELRVHLEQPTEPAQAWRVPGDSPGTAKGGYYLSFPHRENRDVAYLYLEVHPEHRRQGIGSALLRHAARQAARDGRSVLGSGVIQGSAGEAFARHAGAAPGLVDARRVLHVGKLLPGQVTELRESAARGAAGYSLVSWTGRTPEEYMAGFAAVHNAMRDAPRDAGREARAWDAERVRVLIDDQRDNFGSRGYTVAALHDSTGEMAAITQVEVHPDSQDWGRQQITAVARPHRGHRLGLLTKAAMLDWLAAAEPQLQRIVTWNAADNKHMVAINEALGYELLDPQSRHYNLPVESVLAGALLG